MKSANSPTTVPVTELFAALSNFDDFPFEYSSKDGNVVVTDPVYGRDTTRSDDLVSSEGRVATFTTTLDSGRSELVGLQAAVTLAVPAGKIPEPERSIDAIFETTLEAELDNVRTVREIPPPGRTRRTYGRRELVDCTIERHSEVFHTATGSTETHDFDVQVRRLPVGVLSVRTQLRGTHGPRRPPCPLLSPDETAEPIYPDEVDVSAIGETILDRVGRHLEPLSPGDLVLGGATRGEEGSERTGEGQQQATFQQFVLDDADVPTVPGRFEQEQVTVEQPIAFHRYPVDYLDALSAITDIENTVSGSNEKHVDFEATASFLIPIAAGPRVDSAFQELRRLIVDWYTEIYRDQLHGKESIEDWHVWDPDHRAFVACANPTSAERNERGDSRPGTRIHHRPNTETLICFVAPTGTRKVVRLRECSAGLAVAWCSATCSDKNVEGGGEPYADSGKSVPSARAVASHSRSLVEALVERGDGLSPSDVKLTKRP